MKLTESSRRGTNRKIKVLNDISYIVAKEGSLGKVTNAKAIQGIYQQIREVLIQARSRAWQAVNTEMVVCYWQIGRLIIEEEQRGETRAIYGKGLIKELSGRLRTDLVKWLSS